MDLTDTQQAILALIAERIEAEGMPPSQAEIARAFGFKGVRAAQYHLEALEAAGASERVPGRARGIRRKVAPPQAQAELALPPASNDDALRLPVLGRVAAGLPIGADVPVDEREAFDRAFARAQHLTDSLGVPLARVTTNPRSAKQNWTHSNNTALAALTGLFRATHGVGLLAVGFTATEAKTWWPADVEDPLTVGLSRRSKRTVAACRARPWGRRSTLRRGSAAPPT